MGVGISLRDWLRRRREGMECRAAVELMTGYLEGALDHGQRDRFEAHLAACPACVAYLDQMRTTVCLLGHLAPEGLTADVRAELVAIYRAVRER